MPSVIILRRAEVELTDACNWYEQKQAGLSMKLRREIDIKIGLILQNPYIFPTRFRSEFRVAPIVKFPYLVVYWYEQATDTVFVTSIFHTKRNPAQIK